MVVGMVLSANSTAKAEQGDYLVSGFNDGTLVNTLGETWEVWLKDSGDDPTQTCKISVVEGDALNYPDGKSMKLEYDVDSENPAYNGARVALKDFDASGYGFLNIYVKGDSQAGFTSKLKIEVIGPTHRPSPYILEGINVEWQKFTIPLTEFWVVNDWTKLYQFVVVFDDMNSNPKAGTIYVDEISFTK